MTAPDKPNKAKGVVSQGEGLAVARYGRRWNATDVMGTPDHLFRTLDAEFGFTMDVCALPENALCSSFYPPTANALWQPWDGVCWCNPPYSDIAPWVRKAWESTSRGTTTVMLLPARSDLGWWHDYVLQYAEVRFIRGRIRFKGRAGGAPFPSCIVVFRPRQEGWLGGAMAARHKGESQRILEPLDEEAV